MQSLSSILRCISFPRLLVFSNLGQFLAFSLSMTLTLTLMLLKSSVESLQTVLSLDLSDVFSQVDGVFWSFLQETCTVVAASFSVYRVGGLMATSFILVMITVTTRLRRCLSDLHCKVESSIVINIYLGERLCRSLGRYLWPDVPSVCTSGQVVCF